MRRRFDPPTGTPEMGMRTIAVGLLATLLALLPLGATGCDVQQSDGESLAASTVQQGADSSDPVTLRPDTTTQASIPDGVDTLPPEQIEGGRRDSSWRRSVGPDTAVAPASASDTSSPGAAGAGRERLDARTLERYGIELPIDGDADASSVRAAQVLLDRTTFSPGIIDGHWGKNTEKAVYWLQRREGLSATGTIDSTTLARIVALAGAPDSIVTGHRLTEQNVEGPFVDIPSDIYEKATMDCMCYESLAEKLAEEFHTSADLLRTLNPGVTLDSLKAGQTIRAPNVKDAPSVDTKVARIVVADGGHWVHGLDDAGRVLYHFPSTLGSQFNPSPQGEFTINAIAFDPTWHYQPALLDEKEREGDAMIPPGPNNAVGVVWMDLSKPHYGIHGTAAPETIGYVTSHGCVRLTNWDARFLAERTSAGVPVKFTKVEARASAE